MRPAPVTPAGWARYYALRDGPAALHLCFWYLLLAACYGERLEDDMYPAE